MAGQEGPRGELDRVWGLRAPSCPPLRTPMLGVRMLFSFSKGDITKGSKKINFQFLTKLKSGSVK